MLFPNPSEPVQFFPQLTSKNSLEVGISGVGGVFFSECMLGMTHIFLVGAKNMYCSSFESSFNALSESE